MIHHEPGCIKAGSGFGGLDCCDEVLSSKPASAVGAVQMLYGLGWVNVKALGVKHVINKCVH